MKKYLAILNNGYNRVCGNYGVNVIDLFETQMKLRHINYEHKDGDQYWIWTTDEKAKFINDTFEWISVIKTEL